MYAVLRRHCPQFLAYGDADTIATRDPPPPPQPKAVYEHFAGEKALTETNRRAVGKRRDEAPGALNVRATVSRCRQRSSRIIVVAASPKSIDLLERRVRPSVIVRSRSY